MRPFTPFEKTNMEYLVNHNVKFTQVQITATGVKKSILDATTPMRTYFKDNNIHDYELQSQGPENKVTKKRSSSLARRLLKLRRHFTALLLRKVILAYGYTA